MLHLHGWRNDSVLYVEPKAFLSDGTDLVELLRAVPPERVARMQRALAESVVRVAYLRDVLRDGARRRDEDDAMDVALKGWAFGLPPGSAADEDRNGAV